MRQPPPRVIPTIRQPPGYDVTASLGNDSLDDDATRTPHNSRRDVGLDVDGEHDGDAPPARHLLADEEPAPRRRRSRTGRRRRDEAQGCGEDAPVRSRRREKRAGEEALEPQEPSRRVILGESSEHGENLVRPRSNPLAMGESAGSVESRELPAPLKTSESRSLLEEGDASFLPEPEWPVLRDEPDQEEPAQQEVAQDPGEKRSTEAEPRRRLASLALASGTGEDVAALGTKGPRPRMFLAIRPFRVLIVFLAVLLLVLWGWLALRMVPSAELAAGDGPESSALSDSDNTAKRKATVKAEKSGGSTDGPGTGGEAGQQSSNKPHDAAPNGEPSAPGTGTKSSGPSGTVVVYISGAIKQPGVYTLPTASRVNDLVTAAGGLAENADSAGINLAAQLADSQHVHIPEPGEVPPDTGAAVPGSAGAASSAEGSEGNGGASELININTAGESELQELPGIGPALSGAIVQWREEHGSFTSVDDLLDVPGVGPAKLSQLREHATV
ncbi:MAG: ComEA family DNA-binding protein [Ancrocorticia sp.]